MTLSARRAHEERGRTLERHARHRQHTLIEASLRATREERHSEARELCKAAIAMASECADAWLLHARLDAAAGDLRAARRAHDEARALCAESPEVAWLSSSIAIADGEIDRARSDLDRAQVLGYPRDALERRRALVEGAS